MFDSLEEILKLPQDDAAEKGELILLYGMVAALKPHYVVETGTHKGVSALAMAAAMFDEDIDGVIHTADPRGWGAEQNAAKFPHLAQYIDFQRCRGDEMNVDGKIDLLFLDGLHERDEVLSEFEYLKPKMSEDCVVVFHDAGGDNAQVGVNEAVKKLGIPNVAINTHNSIRVGSYYNPM